MQITRLDSQGKQTGTERLVTKRRAKRDTEGGKEDGMQVGVHRVNKTQGWEHAGTD